jgi:hypothetical protein
MREIHTLCRPFVLLASQQRGIDLSRLSFPTEDDTGTGTAVCARCGFAEEIASRLGGGEVDPDNDKWYCKPCWDEFRANGVATAPGDQQEEEQDDDEDEQDSSEAAEMATDMAGTQQDGDGEVAMDTGNGEEAIASEEEEQPEQLASG